MPQCISTIVHTKRKINDEKRERDHECDCTFAKQSYSITKREIKKPLHKSEEVVKLNLYSGFFRIVSTTTKSINGNVHTCKSNKEKTWRNCISICNWCDWTMKNDTKRYILKKQTRKTIAIKKTENKTICQKVSAYVMSTNHYRWIVTAHICTVFHFYFLYCRSNFLWIDEVLFLFHFVWYEI